MRARIWGRGAGSLAEDGHELALGDADGADAKFVDREFVAVGAVEREFFGGEALRKSSDLRGELFDRCDEDGEDGAVVDLCKVCSPPSKRS